MDTAEGIRSILRTCWHRAAQVCEPVNGGLHASVWLVAAGGERFVAMSAPAGRRAQLDAGLRAAERLDKAGIPAGVPVRAVDGALSVGTPGGAVALLRHVPGRGLVGSDPVDQQWWGDALGRAHRALAGFTVAGLPRWHWVRPQAAHLAVEDWVRPAVAGAVAAVARLSVTDVLTYGILHGDPAPDVFRLDAATGCTGVAGWGAAAAGPLVYDVASAVMYAGGADAAGDLVDAYRATAAVPADEVTAALPVMLRFRWAAQADHFARRFADGVADTIDVARLHQARDALAGY